MPLYEVSADASFISASLACIQASLGDAIMLLISYWVLSAFLHTREWIFQINPVRLGLFLIPGIAMTIVFELLAIGPLQRWTYGDLMPLLPIIKIGIVPIAQWIVLPPIALWLVRNQTEKRCSQI